MNPLTLIDKFYPEENELKRILLVHSRSVTDKALALAKKHPGRVDQRLQTGLKAGYEEGASDVVQEAIGQFS